MMNFWLLLWLVLTIWLIPIVDGTGISYSFTSGLSCILSQSSTDTTDSCFNSLMVINFLTFCVIFNFYSSIKVIKFEDANLAILVQQLGPVVAVFVFSSKAVMGQFYDGGQNSWEQYVSIGFILIAFVLYKFHKTSVNKELAQDEGELNKVTLFERMWIKPENKFKKVANADLHMNGDTVSHDF